jgi:acetyl esterase/lipase
MKEIKVKILGWVGICALALSAAAHASVVVPTTRPALTVVRPWIPSGFHAIRDVPYVPNARRSQMLDVYLPDMATAPRPLMVWIHGGGWSSGDKSAPPGMGLLLRGYVVASINYRLSREAVFPAQIYDCKAAIRFLRSHAREFDIDPARIGVWGCSAGGQLASLLGATNGRPEYEGIEAAPRVSSNVQAVCDWFGPSDFLQWKELSGPGAIVVNQFLGGIASARDAAAKFASPAEQVGRSPAVPFLIMHGDQDKLVPLRQSQILYERLRKAGATVRLEILPHTGHGTGWFLSHDTLGTVYDFFDRCFKKPTFRNLATTRP